MKIYNILQNLIYTFNKDSVRSRVIRPHLKKDYIYKGTFILDKQFPSFNLWRMQKNKKYLFTVAYRYRSNRIHYVAFVYDASTHQLICFDPGYNLYLYGRFKIIPIVISIFKQSIPSLVVQGKCPMTKYGIQFTNQSKFPADAFCQTWTLFFLISYLHKNGDISFFKEWCKIPPSKRQYFLLHHFVLPTTKKHIPKEHYKMIQAFINTNYLST